MTRTAMLKTLVVIANKLDERGMTKEADIITGVAERVALLKLLDEQPADLGKGFEPKYGGPYIDEMIESLAEGGFPREKLNKMTDEQIKAIFSEVSHTDPREELEVARLFDELDDEEARQRSKNMFPRGQDGWGDLPSYRDDEDDEYSSEDWDNE